MRLFFEVNRASRKDPHRAALLIPAPSRWDPIVDLDYQIDGYRGLAAQVLPARKMCGAVYSAIFRRAWTCYISSQKSGLHQTQTDRCLRLPIIDALGWVVGCGLLVSLVQVGNIWPDRSLGD